jgi:hypothetical protein
VSLSQPVDHELARHLNHEAAKAVKYGDVPEEKLSFAQSAKQPELSNILAH